MTDNETTEAVNLTDLDEYREKHPPGEHRYTIRIDEYPVIDEFMGGFLRTKKGVIRTCEYNQIRTFNHPEIEGTIYYDEFSQQICFNKSPPWTRKAKPGVEPQWNGVDDNSMAAWLQERGIYVSAPHIANVVLTAAIGDTRNPVRDYLDGLEWDQQERIDTWLTDFFGVEPTVYSTSVGAMWLISAIARIYDPGCQVDHMLVLEGAQGIGKSTALRHLAHGWFADSLPDLSNKDAALQLNGKWITEMSELEGLNRSESHAAKAFVARRTDRYRAPYGRTSEDFPRYNVFIGTTNSSNYLKDQTGNRRYWPVKCRAVKINEIETVHNQLWAEATVRYKGGSHWWPESDTLRDLCAEAVGGRTMALPWEEKISSFLIGKEETSNDNIMANLEILTEHRHQGHINTISTIMQKLGWSRKRVRRDGCRVYRYVAPLDKIPF